jgi:acid phosphatase
MNAFFRNVAILGSLTLPFGTAFAARPLYGFKKVMIVMFENEDAKKVLDQPTFKRFAEHGAYFSNLNAEAHPSQANYIALISGSMNGVKGDGNQNVDAKHVGDLLEDAGLGWKAYLEGYPGNCFTGARSGNYARKHNPFISFRNIQTDRARCDAHLVNADTLKDDVAHDALPNFSLYIPDLKNDGHDTGVEYADRWFAKTIEPLFQVENFMRDMLVVVTFDESETLGGNRIYGAFYGDSVQRGIVDPNRYDHYSILRTIEDALHLGSLGLNDAKATPITKIWK